jgi:glycosyltransferase involved in cell wall biosynthesis
MATTPYFVLGPQAALSLTGLTRGPDRTTPTPSEDWREATVDVVIPAFNEAETIVFCLASLLRQTLRPRHIVLIDDGSTDGTIDSARAFCDRNGLKLIAIQRRKPIGKTPTIKRQAREFDSDVEFILDGDTILESPTYLERTVQELYQGVGIASACGTILPLRRRDRRALAQDPTVKAFASVPVPQPVGEEPPLRAFARGITNLYREVLYLFLQRFINHGQMVFFGTVTNPVGCAVAYRRKYVEALFDHFGPTLGDDLTNSEDIFLGMGMLNEGYRNIQLTDVYARTVEPVCGRLPHQVYLWSSSFLQSCFYFDALVKSPLRAHKRWLMRRRPPQRKSGVPAEVAVTAVPALASASGLAPLAPAPVKTMLRTIVPAGAQVVRDSATAAGGDRRVVREAYRQAFGRQHTLKYGRPAGWLLFTSAIEKVFFPTVLLIMLLVRNWEGFWLTIALESLIALTALVVVTKGERAQYFVKGLAVIPMRYALLVSELVTLGRFAVDLWVTGNRKWRK